MPLTNIHSTNMEIQTPVCNRLEPWFMLTNKVVLITGASSGLGREFSLDLARAGCKIIAAARRVDRLKSLCDEINNMSVPDEPRRGETRAVAVELDVMASEQAIAASVKKAWNAFGTINALINNAGVRGRLHAPLDLSEDEWMRLVRTNLTGTWLVSKYVCKLMQDTKYGGSIITISSIAALDRGQLPGGLAYAASKSGVNSITKVMALELGAYNIRVNSISPGLFKSEITKDLVEKAWLAKVAWKTCPLRTYGTVDPALTSVLRYLIHDFSQYVTGNSFIVDAGVTLLGTPIFSSL